MTNAMLGSSTKEFYFDKKEAEYRVWDLNNNRTNPFMSYFYTVNEVEHGQIVDKNSKKYKKFLEEEKKEIEKQIEVYRKDRDSNMTTLS